MDRKSNTYVFQGADRSWKPLPTERPGTDPWVALARSRRENEALRGEIEELQDELARLMNGATIAHSELSNGPETAPTQDASHSYETSGPVRSSEESGPIAHSELSNGPDTIPLKRLPTATKPPILAALLGNPEPLLTQN